MDNYYKCELEVWESQGYLAADRFFASLPDFNSSLMIKKKSEKKKYKLSYDNEFGKLICFSCVCDDSFRVKNYKDMIGKASFVDVFLIITSKIKEEMLLQGAKC